MTASSYISYSPQKVPLYQDAYHDNGFRNFQKLHADYRNVELDAVTDKDAGEDSYLDFYSLALSVKQILIFSAIDFGNYSISLGNGILFSNSNNISKSAGPISPLFIRDAYSLRPYQSRSEDGFLKGVAFAIPVGNFEFTGFTSSKILNAHGNQAGLVTSIDYTGLDLPTSTSGLNLKERIAGGILRFDSPYLDCGASAVSFSYDRMFANYYTQSHLAGDFFLRTQSERATFSGEMLVDKTVSFSANAGLDYDEAKFTVGARDLRSRIVPNYSVSALRKFSDGSGTRNLFRSDVSPGRNYKIRFLL